VLALLKKVNFGTMDSFCENKYKMLNDTLSVQVCKTPLGFCKNSCSLLNFYKGLELQCLERCMENW